MSDIEEFLEEYNALVIGDEETTKYQIIHTGTEEPWGTFPAPADLDKVLAAVSRVGSQLATGNHSIRIQAIGRDGGIRGQLGLSVEGKSAAARSSGNEMVQHAKALRMNIETADTQLANMSARLQAADQRAREAEDRAGNMAGDVYKMGDLVNKMLMDKESAIIDRDERESRMQNMAKITETLVPVLGQGFMIFSKYMEHKVRGWEAEWAASAEAAKSKVDNSTKEESETKPN